MPQLLLFPDPRPLVERLGAEFFRRAPASPGVYLMRDAREAAVYVGKAKNLRKRLACYRVANPDRLRRRHLRLLRAVARIEFQTCEDERAALAREAELLLQLRPRFNRAGTWPGQPRFILWRASGAGLELALTSNTETGWTGAGPLGAGALAVLASLARQLWCALHPERGLTGMPQGWFAGRLPKVAVVPWSDKGPGQFHDLPGYLAQLFSGEPIPFTTWVQERTQPAGAFGAAVRALDLEALTEFSNRRNHRRAAI